MSLIQKFKSLQLALVIALVSLVAAMPAAATGPAAPDVSGVVTAIGGAAAPIAAIGGAVLLVIVGIKIYKWVRRAM